MPNELALHYEIVESVYPQFEHWVVDFLSLQYCDVWYGTGKKTVFW